MKHAELGRDLRAVAAEVEWPSAPDLAAAVRARIADEPAGARTLALPPLRARLAASPLALAAIVLVVLVVAAALVPPARSAILRVLGITHGARIVRVEEAPKVSKGSLDLGRSTTLAQARRRLAFRVLLPAALGPPTRVRYSAAIAGGAVTLSWPGYVLTEFQGQALPYFQKFVGPKTKVRRTSIGGRPAYFLSGAPHQTLIVDRNDKPIMSESALVHANVLLWDAGRLSFRLETRRGLSDALGVARAMPIR